MPLQTVAPLEGHLSLEGKQGMPEDREHSSEDLGVPFTKQQDRTATQNGVKKNAIYGDLFSPAPGQPTPPRAAPGPQSSTTG